MGYTHYWNPMELEVDAELAEEARGFQVLSFGVAVNDRRRNPQTGEWEDCANFVDCVMFGNRAASVARRLSKGSKVAVEGKLRWSQWEAKDGSRRSKLEVAVDEIELLSPKAGAAQPDAETAEAFDAMGAAPVLYDEDVPF